MCKYCDTDNFYEITDIPLDFGMLNDSCGKPNVMSYIETNKDDKYVLTTQFSSGDNCTSSETEINYCPFCGRKLAK